MMDMLDLLGCPACHGPLDATGDPAPGWRCPACGQSFVAKGDIPVLLREQDVDHFERFARHYRQARQRDNWQPLTPMQALRLPCGRPAGQPALYWQVRCQSFRVLMAILAREGPPPACGPAADLGAGSGWLSYHLARLGYSVLAVDASRDADWGLGAAARYYLPHVPFSLVQGDLEHPPLQADKLALLVLNASLHYATDLDATLHRLARALKAGGRLVVLDTPIAHRPRPGTGQGDRHLGHQELHAALLAAGLSPRWVPIPRGARWQLHQAKSWLRRDSRFSFPMVLADRLS